MKTKTSSNLLLLCDFSCACMKTWITRPPCFFSWRQDAPAPSPWGFDAKVSCTSRASLAWIPNIVCAVIVASIPHRVSLFGESNGGLLCDSLKHRGFATTWRKELYKMIWVLHASASKLRPMRQKTMQQIMLHLRTTIHSAKKRLSKADHRQLWMFELTTVNSKCARIAKSRHNYYIFSEGVFISQVHGKTQILWKHE